MSTLSSDLRTLSREAFIYFYPFVTMEVTRRQTISLPPDVRPGFGPANQFHHIRTFPPADFRTVVRPNFDTLYSSAWVDLTRGPVRLSVPDSGDRYYMLPMLDMWTDVFASPGKRTTGTGPQEFVLTGPGYRGELPDGAMVIPAPTPYVWIIGRTQTNGPTDYAAVGEFQDGLRLTPLGGPISAADPADVETDPLHVVNSMSAVDYLAYAAETLKTNPPHATDFSQLARLAPLGIVAGHSFDASGFDDGQLADIQAGAGDGLKAIQGAVLSMGVPVDGWVSFTDTMGVYGNFYLKRALIALAGLGANPPEDAIYPLLRVDADGDPVDGSTDYVLHFDAGKLPPVSAFWSVTMYDAEGFQAANELNRFAIGDRDLLTFNSDGSLDLYLQHENPGPDRVSNWLPAPRGPLGVTMRLYAPQHAALVGSWTPPPLIKGPAK